VYSLIALISLQNILNLKKDRKQFKRSYTDVFYITCVTVSKSFWVSCDITDLYKLVWQFPYPMVTPVIGYKENKEIDWLIDWAEIINFINYFCCNLHVSFYYYVMHSVWFGDCRIDICLLYLSMVLYCPHLFLFVCCVSLTSFTSVCTTELTDLWNNICMYVCMYCSGISLMQDNKK